MRYSLLRCANVFLTAVLFIGLSATAHAATGESSGECLVCHRMDIQSAKGDRVISKTDTAELGQTVHAKLACMDCHTAKDPAVEPGDHKASRKTVDCGVCHSRDSGKGAPALDTPDGKHFVHGRTTDGGNAADTPTCKGCHGTHNIRKREDPKSTINPFNLPGTCAKCHSDAALTKKHNIKEGMIKAYLKSIHGTALKEKGLSIAAVCSDCHGSHDIRPPKDADSRVSRKNVPETCAKCHQGIFKKYIGSIHGQELTRGNNDVPVCTDCHGEHTIRQNSDPDSKVYPTHVAKTCSNCHDNVTLTKKYGLPKKRLKTISETFHGVAVEYGDIRAANCASCHGTHDILPSNDRNSSINPKNLPKTCGKCHKNTGENYAKGKIHVEATRESNPGMFYVRKFYYMFIPILIGGFILYIVTDLISRSRKKKKG